MLEIKHRIAELVEALSFFPHHRKRRATPFGWPLAAAAQDRLRQAQGYGFICAATLLLAACSTAPRAVSERDMHGIFSADATPGSRALMVQFLNDGRFGGDKPEPGGVVRTQGYWRIGAFDSKRACTIIETKPRTGEWREGFCAAIEGERTALNCKGEGDARSCLMVRRPGRWKRPSS